MKRKWLVLLGATIFGVLAYLFCVSMPRIIAGALTALLPEGSSAVPPQGVPAMRLLGVIAALTAIVPAALPLLRDLTRTAKGPACPACRSPMVARSVRRGDTTENSWRCSRYPACTEEIRIE